MIGSGGVINLLLLPAPNVYGRCSLPCHAGGGGAQGPHVAGSVCTPLFRLLYGTDNLFLEKLKVGHLNSLLFITAHSTGFL